MGDTAAPDHRTMSLHLARALDEIGLNTRTVKKRRHTFLCAEQIFNVYQRLKGRNMTKYHFGSQTEGTTTPGLKSDIDTLACHNVFNVIEDMADWAPGKRNMLMLQEDTAPGYCRLQALRDDVPLGAEDLPRLAAIDNKGRVILNNNMIFTLPDLGLPRNGPAESSKGRPDCLDYDFVLAFHCKNWPRQAEEFIKRRRRYGWPSQSLIEEATSHGVFLVPVGHKLSPTEPLEWRISASLAERCLMFSLKIVHIKCYVVLKILMKTFIEPRIQKCISSYHCKTALLYCTENTEPGFWREDNLLSCVIKCMEMLRIWVSDLFCPQFIIREENLYAGKVTPENRDLILSILTEMIESVGRILLCVTIDDLGQHLQTKMNGEPSRAPLTYSVASVRLFAEMDQKIDSFLCATVTLENSGDHTSVMRSVYRDIVKLQGMINTTHKHERQVINNNITLLSCWLGSLMASFSLAHAKRVPRIAMQLLCTAAKHGIYSMLKLATIFYCNGKFRKTEILLSKICAVIGKKCHAGVDQVHTRVDVFAHSVIFSRHEVHCVPPAIHYELYRDVGDEMEHSRSLLDKLKRTDLGLAVVDCLPYLYYLQYLTYTHLGKQNLQKLSFKNLQRCVREDEMLNHDATALNLLGQCLESERGPSYALGCYRDSLKIKPRNNAAKWHVAILWYKIIKNNHLLFKITGDQKLGFYTAKWLSAIFLYVKIRDYGLLQRVAGVQRQRYITATWNVEKWCLALVNYVDMRDTYPFLFH